MERVKGELRALNLGNQKRKWNDRSTSSERVAQKKPTAGPNKSCPVAPKEPSAKCGRINQ